MPNAHGGVCPMPYARRVPHVTEKGYSINYCYFSLGNDAMPTNSIASPPARIAKASKPTTKSNPDVFSIKLNRSPIKSNHRYLLIAECLPTMGKRRKKPNLKVEKKQQIR